MHAFITEQPRDESDPSSDHWINLVQQQTTLTASFELTQYLVPEAKTFNLLNDGSSSGSGSDTQKNKKAGKSVVHITKKLRLTMMTDPHVLPTKEIAEDLYFL